LQNGDELHLLMESAEAGIGSSEEIGMIFVVLRDLGPMARACYVQKVAQRAQKVNQTDSTEHRASIESFQKDLSHCESDQKQASCLQASKTENPLKE